MPMQIQKFRWFHAASIPWYGDCAGGYVRPEVTSRNTSCATSRAPALTNTQACTRRLSGESERCDCASAASLVACSACACADASLAAAALRVACSARSRPFRNRDSSAASCLILHLELQVQSINKVVHHISVVLQPSDAQRHFGMAP